MLLVSGATTTIRPLVQSRPDIFGVLAVPGDRNSLPEQGAWAGDNGAFSGFVEAPFLAMLNKHLWARERCLFVAAPDVVGDCAATGALFDTWGGRIRDRGYRVALVAQDGLTWDTTPWDDLDAIFIGGSTEFKLGADAARIAVEAQLLGKWVHMGRVNTARRLHYAAAVGCDSVDGSGWSRFPTSMLERHGSLLRSLSSQRRLVMRQHEAHA